MYKILDMEQGSEEWLEFRKGKVTASMVAGARGLSKFNTPVQTARYCLGYDKPIVNEAMSHGTKTEPIARDKYRQITGNTVKEVGIVVNDKHSYFAYSPDGLIVQDDKIIGLLEIKCPKRMYTPISEFNQIRKLKNELYDQKKHIYISHYDQMSFGMYLMDLKWCDYFVYVDDNNHYLERVFYDNDYCENYMIPDVYNFVSNVMLPMM